MLTVSGQVVFVAQYTGPTEYKKTKGLAYLQTVVYLGLYNNGLDVK